MKPVGQKGSLFDLRATRRPASLLLRVLMTYPANSKGNRRIRREEYTAESTIPPSLHHWGRGTASAVEGVRLSLLTEQKLLIGKVGLMGKRAYPDGEAEYLDERRTGTKTGSVFVPRLYPSPPKCGRRFGFAENGDSRR